MSVYFNKSGLLKELKFKYTMESVIRFYSKKGNYFFAVHDITQGKVIELINYLIEHTKDQFYVSYFCYQAGMELFITPNKLQSKPYWFNCHAYSDSLTRSATNVFIPVRIPMVLLDSIENLSKKLGPTKGELISLALINEFSENTWLNTFEHDNIIDALENDAYEYKAYNKQKHKTDIVEIADWSRFKKELVKISGTSACDPHLIKQFIIELKKRYRYKVEYMKDLGEYKEMRYSIKSISRDLQTLREDKLPLNFSLHKLEHLFTQNIDCYNHAYKLYVYDPFIKNDFVYYPTLIGFLPNSKAKSCNFSIPISVFEWVNDQSGPSDRVRSGMFIQALNNSILGWEKKLNSKNMSKVNENLNRFLGSFK